MEKRLLILLLAVGSLNLFSLWSCSDSSRDGIDSDNITSETIVGKVGDLPVTVRDVVVEYQGLAQPSTKMEATAENAWDQAKFMKMAYIKARSFEDYDPKEVHRLVKNRLHNIVMGYMFEDLFSSDVEIAEAEIESVYQARIDAYTIPERRVVTHVLSSTNPKAWSTLEGVEEVSNVQAIDSMAHARAQHLYELLQEGANMKVMAGEYSHDTQSRDNEGTVGPFIERDMVPEFSEVAFNLEIGEISRPFKSIYGWHIIRLDSIIPGEVQKLDQRIYDQIRAELDYNRQVEKAQAFVDSLAQEVEIEWNDELLNADIESFDPYDWVCVVNGTDSVPASILREHEMMYRVRNSTSDITPEIRKAIIGSLIKPFVLSSAARALGYFDSDTIKTAYRNLKQLELRSRILRRRTPQIPKWTEEEKRAFYDEHIDLFMPEKPIKIKQILIKDQDRLEEALAALKAGEEFDKVAERYGQGSSDSEGSKATQAEPGWISEQDVPEKLFQRAWITIEGNITAPIETEYGYHIIKVVEKKKRLQYESVGSDLLRAMREHAYKTADEEWREWVSDGLEVELYDEVLSAIDFDNYGQYLAPGRATPPQSSDSLGYTESDTIAAGGSE